MDRKTLKKLWPNIIQLILGLALTEVAVRYGERVMGLAITVAVGLFGFVVIAAAMVGVVRQIRRDLHDAHARRVV